MIEALHLEGLAEHGELHNALGVERVEEPVGHLDRPGRLRPPADGHAVAGPGVRGEGEEARELVADAHQVLQDRVRVAEPVDVGGGAA